MDGPLPGGNMNRVERRGDTVLRDAGPWTPTIHRLLDHLAAAGLRDIPRPLGVEGAREVLSFVDGDVPLYPLPAWVWSDDALVESGRMLRRMHDATIGFPLDDAVWRSPARVPAEVICHTDFAPHNLVYRDGHVIGVIDFDHAAPGPRLWDLAHLALRGVPLAGAPQDGAPPMSDALRRIRLLLESYGTDAIGPDAGAVADTDADAGAVVRVAILRLRDLAEFSERMATELEKPELARHAEHYREEAEFLQEWWPSADRALPD